MNTFPNWLHKDMVQGIRGFNLDAYLMALEGWQRGLTTKWYLDPAKVTDLQIIGFYALGKTFSLSDASNTHYFYRSRGDLVANEAVKQVTDKQVTRQLLSNAQIPVLEGKSFSSMTPDEKLLDYAKAIAYPLVVKPTVGSLGRGVKTNIQTDVELLEGVSEIRSLGYEQITIESYFPGDDYRVYVIGDEVVAATKRVPAHVVGDGKRTIEDLIESKNNERKQNPYLQSKLIKMDNTMKKLLDRNKLHLSTIPEENEIVFLRDAANIAHGGDPIEAMDELSSEMKKAVVEAVQAIPGLVHAGVDLLVNEEKESIILKMNSTADIGMHIFPQQGEAVNIPSKIIDYYFPSTKNQSTNRQMYFDYKRIRRLFRKRLVQSYELENVVLIKFAKARYIVKGKVQKVSYRKWIQRQAVNHGVHGYTRNLKNGNVVVVVGGNEKKVEDFRKICQKGSRRAKVEKVVLKEWNKPIETGFVIKKTK